MSVDYKSALIYGFNCEPDKFSYEELEKLEEIGLDVISDCYSDNFLYIGKCISKTSCGEEARVDCLKYLEQAEIDVRHLLREVPEELKKNLPLFPSIYHLCYAV